MAHEKTKKAAIRLPDTVIDLVDLGRLQREIEGIDNFLAQAAVREAGKSLSLPRTTKNLETLAKESDLNLLVDADRQRLADFLQEVRSKAPVIHISFAAEPSTAFLEKIISWFRSSIHAQTLLQVGLQPSIAAGCILRTPNKYFDLSLRQNFSKHTQILIDKLVVQETHS